jgi:hypothetical protein
MKPDISPWIFLAVAVIVPLIAAISFLLTQ